MPAVRARPHPASARATVVVQMAAAGAVASDAVKAIVRDSEINARLALEELLFEGHMYNVNDTVLTKVESALDSLADIDGGPKASAAALLAMRDATDACDPVPSQEQFLFRYVMPYEQFLERVEGVANTVRDLAVGRCLMTCKPMNDRLAFIAVLKDAFGDDVLNKDKNLFSRLLYAHRNLIPEEEPRFLTNSEQAEIKHGSSHGLQSRWVAEIRAQKGRR